jgi:hypothetical protein
VCIGESLTAAGMVVVVVEESGERSMGKIGRLIHSP